MAQNIQLRQKLNDTFNDTNSVLYPQTIPSQVVGLLSGGKLASSYIPDALFGGLKFTDTISGTDDGNGNYIENVTDLSPNGISGQDFWDQSGPQDDRYNGAYWIATRELYLDITSGGNGVEVYIENQGTTVTLDDTGTTGDVAKLQAGDWLVFSGVNLGGETGTAAYYFSVVNNTYALATTSSRGLMSSADKTKLDGIAANANNYSHPSISAVNVDTSGATIIDSIVSNGNGHLTSVGTRTLTLADLGYSAPSIPDAANDGLLDINAGSGISLTITGGDFTADKSSETDITIAHADTSSETSLTALTGANVVSDIDIDGFGHITNLATRAMTLADLGYSAPTIGNGTFTVTAGSGLTGGGTLGTANQTGNSSVTINHQDTSSAASIDLDPDETINAITIDTYGHITALTKQDIQSASESQKGLIEIATSGTAASEAETGTDDTRAMTPAATKDAINYRTGNTLYGSVTLANAADHPDGSIVFVTV